MKLENSKKNFASIGHVIDCITEMV